eukprot:TRINITY_DN68563_c0_g1_i1.p1 TRINITY_DN68563_c0_g1~~TRINITY_DN68563_c0_g1_i1.p1  ORF type:complete len:315 (-),score=39.09 TRINITY_DN68563_c0_g1_i1:1329-2273(-)
MSDPSAAPHQPNADGDASDATATPPNANAPTSPQDQIRTAGTEQESQPAQYPICFRCRRFITNEMIRALNQTWHTECFVCTKPDCKGSFEKEFAVVAGLPFHAQCVPKDSSSIPCALCAKALGEDAAVVAGQHYHPACVKCATCGQTIASELQTVDGRFFHPQCLAEKGTVPTTFCGTCNEAFLPGASCVKAGGSVYHPECLKCAVCKELITAEIVYDGVPFHPKCIAPADAPCSGCGKVIETADGKTVLAVGRRWHPGCLCCSHCSKPIGLGDKYKQLELSVFHPQCLDARAASSPRKGETAASPTKKNSAVA